MKLEIINNAIPRFIRNKIDAASFGIIRFMEFASRKVRSSDKLLDAGAGSCPYKKYFANTKYESTDFCPKHPHNFICNIESIPKQANSYDIIVNTHVLEHVENPQKVIKEFYRILRPGGKLFLTAPQGWGVHGEPYHFFNFTNFGLKSLFTKAGFHIIFIKPMGGMFWYLGKRIKTFPSYIMFQYLFENNNKKPRFKPKPLALLLFPFYLMALPFCNFLIPLLFFYLDRLDKKQDYTLGYACYCKKQKETE